MTKVIFLAFLLSVPALLAGADKPPKLTVDTLVYDFGKVTGAATVEGKFKLTNNGQGTLKFAEPRVSCGCTVASIKPAALGPGESAELDFALSLPKARAHISKHLTVISNDPTTPELELTLNADFVPIFDVSPLTWTFDIRQGQQTNFLANITRTDGKPLRVDRLETSRPWVRAELKPIDEKSSSISIHLDAQGRPRRLGEVVRVFADGNKEEPVGYIQILGRVLGDVVITPESIFWNITNAEQINSQNTEFTTKRLLAKSTIPGASFELKKVSSSIPDIDVSMTKKGENYEIVTHLVRVPVKTSQGKITIETTFPNQPQLEVPLTVYVAQSLSKAVAKQESNDK